MASISASSSSSPPVAAPVSSTMDKRTASPPVGIMASPKRQKISESSSSSTTIERSELDSALALASLALNSPVKVMTTTRPNADLSPKANATTSEEPRSEQLPVQVSPGSPANENKRKRVHFSQETASGPSAPTSSLTTASRLIRRRRPMMVPQRKMIPPPPPPLPYRRHHPHHHHHPMMIPTMPPGAYGRHHHVMYRQWMPIARVPPPPPPPSMVTADGKNQTWVCDFCNSAAFATYEETCMHEQMCKHTGQHSRKAGMTPVSPPTRRPFEEQQQAARQDQETARASDDDDNKVWFSGCVALAVEPADKEWLSELNCFVRKHCIEAFSATELDVIKTSKRGRIVMNQVGIRCKFCVNHHFKDKAVAAVSYPTSMAGIYESVKRWQRVHLQACTSVPDEIQQNLNQLQADTVWVPTTRQYWTDSARALGMKDTNDGIRFERDPAAPPSLDWTPEAAGKQCTATSSVTTTATVAANSATSTTTANEAQEYAANNAPPVGIYTPKQQQESGGYICFPQDSEMVPPYVHFLMRQVEPCYFTEADRFVARSKGPVGFAGFQCRHCNGHAGLGKYFPLTPKALSTNSTSQNIHAHLLKCRKSPLSTKDELVCLKSEKLKSPRLVPGWRKTFFDKIWGRLHGETVKKD